MLYEVITSFRPTASFAAIFAIGKPVALDASAELRLTLGFISIIITRPSSRITSYNVCYTKLLRNNSNKCFFPEDLLVIDIK